ncbi:hypothetical protein VA7868_02781 [Vibrio aerogenes CECT 7868]|uniref:Uncharacterized protein n=1 Tax=Vibrio aerogenes CECT 7868 TaxID=1216006 RepID=A0A1M5ZI67_9VIBR|nr:hypothetical protein VA7868_02781 [Vibrio aerogenes CECT 7868]
MMVQNSARLTGVADDAHAALRHHVHRFFSGVILRKLWRFLQQ